MNTQTVLPPTSPEVMRKPYRKPRCQPLGEMKRVTQKTGPSPDNPGNPTKA